MSHTDYHEDTARLSARTQDMHRAIVSLQEELEAVDWYQQRADACSNAALKGILEHNMEEEIEHAAMVLEWLRRNHPMFDAQLRTYLFTEGDILTIEDEPPAAADSATPSTATNSSVSTRQFTIGQLRKRAPGKS